MRYRHLGKTGLVVSRLCLGTNNFGTQVDDETSTRILRKAIDSGINMIDTANIYAETRSEGVIGRAISGDRERVVIATKVGKPISEADEPNCKGLSRKHILWQLKESLGRLRTDYIDVYYMHEYDPETPLEETLLTLDYLVREGKVRYIACSNFSLEQIEECNEVCDSLDLERIIAVQPRYNLLQRDVEKGILPYCEEENLGVLAYSPLDGGLLTGKYKEGDAPPDGSRGKANPRYWNRILTEKDFARVEKLVPIAEETKVPLHQLALAWLLRNQAVTGAIVGASRPEQLVESCRVVDLDVPEKVFDRLDNALQE